MPSRVVVATGIDYIADPDSADHLMHSGYTPGYRCLNQSRIVGNHTDSRKTLDYLQVDLSSDLGNVWYPIAAVVLRGFGQTDPRNNQWGIRGSLEKDPIVSFELALPDDLQTLWMTGNLFGRDDDTTATTIWIVQSSEYQSASSKRTLDDELSVLELLAPTEKSDLEELLVLPLNWDSEGGLPATEDAVVKAARLIVEMYTKSQRKLEITSLSAAIDGGVEFTLEGLDGRELFIVIPSSGTEVRFVISLPTDSDSYEDTAGFLGSDRSLDSLVNDLVMLG